MVKLLGVTRVTSDLEASKRFCEDVLGFEPDSFYGPTRWQSYKAQEGVFFAIGEAPGSTDEISFTVSAVEALWEQVRDRAEVVCPLEKTSWGTYRFVVKDPDGNLLAFGQGSA